MKLDALSTAMPAERVGGTWPEFVSELITDDWAIGAWDPETGFLTVDPFNTLNDFKVCMRPGCANPAARVDYCQTCQRGARASGMSIDEFARSRPKSDPLSQRSSRGFAFCEIRNEAGSRCGRAATTRGLCPSHYHALAKRCRIEGVPTSQERLDAFKADRRGKVIHPSEPCAVPSCQRVLSVQRPNCLCDYHESGFKAVRRLDPTQSVSSYIRSDSVLERNQLALRSLTDSVRNELLFVIQQYAARGLGRIIVGKLRPFINDVAKTPHTSLLECFRTHEHSIRLKGLRTTGILLREKAWRKYQRRDPLHEDLVFLQDLPLRETRSARNPDLTGDPLETWQIPQPWLLNAFRAWLGATLETRRIARTCFSICVKASRVLTARRSDGGMDGTRLDYEDMAAAIAAFDQPDLAANKKVVFAIWWELCRVARQLGVWDHIPASFAQDYASQKRRARRSSADQKVESDRVTPTAVIAHMRSHTSQLTVGRHDDMYRCVLELLMETGRRPDEIVTLSTDCLVQDRHGGWLLRYTAHKTGGATKELPVETPVVDSIRRWQAIRNERGIHSPLLFPTPRRRLQDDNTPSMGSRYLGRVLKNFARSLPPVPGPVTDADGNTIDFDLSTVQPYDFRRAYAQRHADNGTPPDVLRLLMDHASLKTTMRYYQVSSRRRRKAVSTLAPLAHDRHGTQVGIGKGRLQLKITPVPYGDCAEPSNVAAGGTACQLRYQCAGCGFFRPNPSHIPEIEKEILKLKSQLRIAESSDTASYLLEAQRGLIADYENVLATMRRRLGELPEAERQEIDTMSEVMRRARSAALAGKQIELREL